MSDIPERIANTTDLDLLKKYEEIIKERKKALQPEKRTKKSEILDKVKKLSDKTKAVEEAQAAYLAEGFLVELEKDKNGLIKRWRLRNRKPKNEGENGGEKPMTDQEFDQIFPELPKEFSAQDIKKALTKAGFDNRTVQPTLTIRIKRGDLGIQKKPGVEKGSGVRYMKTK